MVTDTTHCLGSTLVEPYYAWDTMKQEEWVHYTCPIDSCEYTVLKENFSRMMTHGLKEHDPKVVLVKDHIVNVSYILTYST